MFDVIIIGGGICGTSIARQLSRYKLEIALLEKEEELAFGVSKSNSGIIHPGTQNSPNSLKGRLCVEGNRLARSIFKELEIVFKEVGELIVIFDKKKLPELLKIKKEAEKLGVKKLRVVDSRWLKKNEPNLSGKAYAALFAPTAGVVSPYRYVYALAENAAQNGVKIFLNNRVEKIDKINEKFIVKTNQSEYACKCLINAAGLYADEVSALAGVGGYIIKPRKGEEYLLDKKLESISRHLIFPLPSKNSKGIIMIKTSDGNPMIGPTATETVDKEDLATTEDGLNKVLESIREMFPGISEKDIIAYFSGLRPVAGDDFVIKHEEKMPGLINVLGIQSPGLTAAPAIAVLVGELIEKTGLVLKKKIKFNKTQKKRRRDAFDSDLVCRCELVSAGEIKEAIKRGARTLDGIKFRTRALAGRCHGGFCTTRVLKIMSKELNIPVAKLTKRGQGSEIIKHERA